MAKADFVLGGPQWGQLMKELFVSSDTSAPSNPEKEDVLNAWLQPNGVIHLQGSSQKAVDEAPETIRGELDLAPALCLHAG